MKLKLKLGVKTGSNKGVTLMPVSTKGSYPTELVHRGSLVFDVKMGVAVFSTVSSATVRHIPFPFPFPSPSPFHGKGNNWK